MQGFKNYTGFGGLQPTVKVTGDPEKDPENKSKVTPQLV